MTGERAYESVRTALVGLGGHGRTIRQAAVDAADIEIVAVFDINESEMEEAARHLACETAGSFEELLERGDLEAIVLVTPNALHRPQVEAALDAGLDVFVEKPIANRVADGLAMVEAAERAGRVLAVGHNMRFCRSILNAKQHIEAGAIGRPATIEIHFSADNILHLSGESWRLRPDECPALPVMQLGIHAIDVMHFLFSPVKRVFASGRSVAAPPGVLDSVVAAFGLEDGLEGTLTCNYCSPVRFEFRLSGTDGSLFFTPHRCVLSPSSDRAEEALDYSEFDRESYRLQMEAFAQAVRQRSRPAVDGWAGLEALAVVEAIDRSIQSGLLQDVALEGDHGSRDKENAAETA